MFKRLFLFLSPPLSTHSLSHTPFSAVSPPPRASHRPRGVVFRSLSSALAPPPVTTARGGSDGRRGGGRRGGASVASHAHSPRARDWARVTAARGIALETATAALCRGDVTSECRLERESGAARLAVSICVN